jgi:ABC-type bacteriocin/lantibiotic exporter with double-glycine peptidase domain
MHKNITIKNLSFKFSAQSPTFFNNVNITIAPRKIYFLQGANGSGKSTLFRILQGNVHGAEILQGTILIDGIAHDMSTAQSTDLLHHLVHTVQQDYNSMIADNFSFEENLRFVHMQRHPALAALPAYRPIPELIQRFNIDIHKSVHLLSGGQRQILAILMALQLQPNILLLDEPTAALDPVNTAMVLKFLHELVATTGITLVIISHDQTTINAYPDAGLLSVVIDAHTGARTVLPSINLTQ